MAQRRQGQDVPHRPGLAHRAKGQLAALLVLCSRFLIRSLCRIMIGTDGLRDQRILSGGGHRESVTDRQQALHQDGKQCQPSQEIRAFYFSLNQMRSHRKCRDPLPIG